MSLVLDEIHIPGFSIKDKDGAHLLVGDVEAALGINRHAVRLAQLEEHFRILAGGLCASETVHPGILLGLGRFYLRNFFGGVKRLVPDAGDGGRVRPDDIGIINDRRRLERRRVLLLLSGEYGNWRREPQGQKHKNKERQKFLTTARQVRSNCMHRSYSPTASYRVLRSLWHVEQNAMLLAWSFTSKSGCAEECGWWQVRQFIGVITLVGSFGSFRSETG